LERAKCFLKSRFEVDSNVKRSVLAENEEFKHLVKDAKIKKYLENLINRKNRQEKKALTIKDSLTACDDIIVEN
jgi:hypothetical protein